MLKRDRKAIQESIEHWEEIKSLFEILAPETKDLSIIGGGNPVSFILRDYPESRGVLEKVSDDWLCVLWSGGFCPLCALHNNEMEGIRCQKCPLAEAGFNCNHLGSPWSDFNDHPTLENCERMITTLRSLLNGGGDNV